ncbi:MAG TPA: hypothetical protein VMS17_32270 [Gemmataceae bacterium]|nr:hypothetical protein [Gemmataceae bacterium]
MAARSWIVVVLAGAVASLGASYRTQNFVVDAPTPEMAQQIGQYAEAYRKEKAMLWLGQEMPPWPEPCPLRVTITMNGSGGATSFAFDQGRILGQDMHIEGSLDRLLASVLPHEVTHTVFAYYFRQPVPRWADEGGAVLSEDDIERNRHDQLVRQILNTPGRAIPLRRLFSLTKYPPDVMVLYAEGYSVSNFLVASSNRGVFLNFVAQGMRGDWDGAVKANYGYGSVEELEKAWVESLYHSRPAVQLTSRPTGPAPGDGAERVVVRQTAPPAPPLLEAPRAIVRGQAPDADCDGASPKKDQWWLPAPPSAAPSAVIPASSSTAVWQPSDSSPPPVRLGPPRADVPPPPPHLAQPLTAGPGGA